MDTNCDRLRFQSVENVPGSKPCLLLCLATPETPVLLQAGPHIFSSYLLSNTEMSCYLPTIIIIGDLNARPLVFQLPWLPRCRQRVSNKNRPLPNMPTNLQLDRLCACILPKRKRGFGTRSSRKSLREQV